MEQFGIWESFLRTPDIQFINTDIFRMNLKTIAIKNSELNSC